MTMTTEPTIEDRVCRLERMVVELRQLAQEVVELAEQRRSEQEAGR